MISSREYQVAELIAWGASDKEVAEELYISPETAKTHRKNILHKIHGHNSADLTRWFFEKKCNMCFGLNPRQVRHIAIGLLLLVVTDLFVDSELFRARRTRLPKAREMEARVRTRPIRVRARKYELQPVMA